jgi:hypothetical protein
MAGWGEDEEDWSKVKFDDDEDDEPEFKLPKIKFQIKVAEHNDDQQQQTSAGNGEASEEGSLNDSSSSPSLSILLPKLAPQAQSIRGRRGMKNVGGNDEFDEITKRTSNSSKDSEKNRCDLFFTSTSASSTEEDNESGIPSIVIHPFLPGQKGEKEDGEQEQEQEQEEMATKELPLELGDAVLILDKAHEEKGWYFGRFLEEQKTRRGRRGFFPSSFVQPLCDQVLSAATAREIVKPTRRAKALRSSHNPPSPSLLPPSPLELQLRKGEEIVILHKQLNGWWIGKRLNSSKSPASASASLVGFFPRTFVEEGPLDLGVIAEEDNCGVVGSNGEESSLFGDSAVAAASSPFADDFSSAFGDEAGDDWSSSLFLSMAFTDPPSTLRRRENGEAENGEEKEGGGGGVISCLSAKSKRWSSTIGWNPREDEEEDRRAIEIITHLDQEQNFLIGMRVFIEQYLHPLKETVRKETPSLSFYEVNAMFSHFQQILDNHKQLFGQLCNRVESVATDSSLCVLIGDVVKRTEWMHDLYVKFAATCPLLSEAIKLALRSSDLRKFLREKEKKQPQQQSSSLQSRIKAAIGKGEDKRTTEYGGGVREGEEENEGDFLLEVVGSPLIRFRQFVEFLNRVCKTTPKTHEDSKEVSEVLVVVRTAADVAEATQKHTSSVDPSVRQLYQQLQPKLLVIIKDYPSQRLLSLLTFFFSSSSLLPF